MTLRSLARPLLSAVVLLVAVAGCGNKKYNVVRKGELHTQMWRIWGQIDQLDRLMRTQPPKQADVVAVLRQIENSAKRLTSSSIRSKHPLLKNYAPEFLEEAKAAVKAAAATPPNYYRAGKLTGSCVHCHDPDGGLRSE